MSLLIPSLFNACKLGDLEKVIQLHEEEDVDLNVRDEWDSTPLYYSCLCGHKDVVEYLLQRGAKCAESSFDGERCVYGALTNEIRNILKNWKQVHQSGLKRSRHYEMMSQLLDQGIFYDISIVVHSTKINAHRCLLAFRSPYFAKAFATKWNNVNTIYINNPRVNKDAFLAIMQYLYTGRLDVAYHLVDNIKRLAKNLGLNFLVAQVQKTEDLIVELHRLKPQIAKRVKLFTVENEACMEKLKSDMKNLVDSIVPQSVNNWVNNGILPFTKNCDNTNFADICLNVNGHLFFAHKAFLCGFSDYFRARLDDHFSENSESYLDEKYSLPTIQINQMQADVLQIIISYIYADFVEMDDVDLALETLSHAHMLMIPELCRRCGRILGSLIDEYNVYNLYLVAKNYELSNLEISCTSYMANNIDKCIESEEFTELVEYDAAQVLSREETDSVPLIDDIRYHLSKAILNFSHLEETQMKLGNLDRFLARLKIEC